MENLAKDVVRLSGRLGKPCTLWQAEQALLPARGYGNPEVAVTWLFTEGGFEALERQEIRDRETSYLLDKQDGKTPQSSIILDEDSDLALPNTTQSPIVFDEEKELSQRLLEFCCEKGLDDDIAEQASERFGKFEDACEWISTRNLNPNDAEQENKEKNEWLTTKKRDNSSLTLEGIVERSQSCWTCSRCTLANKECSNHCEVCGEPSPFRRKMIVYEEKLSEVKIKAMKTEEELAASKLKISEELARITHFAQGLEIPEYWDPFPAGEKVLHIELVDAVEGTAAAEERKRIVNVFTSGGATMNKLVSLKRIQNLRIWQRYAAQKDIVASKPSNKGNPNVHYLFHGPRANTDSILQNGFVGQFGVSQPFGTWTHTSSAYSANSFADTSPGGGGRRIFICQAVVGTPGTDNGSGRRPNDITPGVLADCHQNGGIHVFYEDSQLYPEYLICWQ